MGKNTQAEKKAEKEHEWKVDQLRKTEKKNLRWLLDRK